MSVSCGSVSEVFFPYSFGTFFFGGGLPILLDFVCLWIRQRATYLNLK